MMTEGGEERLGDFDISIDLIVEVLKKLPTKSLVRFRSVSKQWSTIIGSCRDFIDSIVTRSLSQPQKLPLFIFYHSVKEPFVTVSSTFSQESTKQATISVPDKSPHWFQYQYVRGLLCLSSPVSHFVTIYNPTTRQSVRLPEIEEPVKRFQKYYCYLGYDPVMDQYKVLYIPLDRKEWNQTIYVFTLGSGMTQKQSWRKIQGIDEKVFPSSQGVCIDGDIYFGAIRVIETKDKNDETLLLRFDIRSERFYHVWAPERMIESLSCPFSRKRTLLNYQGKLGYIGSNMNVDITSLWIMENAEKQQWSTHIFTRPESPLFHLPLVHGFSGVTHAGEIFVAQCSYYVEIQGTSPETTKEFRRHPIIIQAIHDHVENTMWLEDSMYY